jgi:hypothetical protein
MINYYSYTEFVVAKGCRFSLCALKFIGIHKRHRVPWGEHAQFLDLTKAKYSIRVKGKVVPVLN